MILSYHTGFSNTIATSLSPIASLRSYCCTVILVWRLSSRRCAWPHGTVGYWSTLPGIWAPAYSYSTAVWISSSFWFYHLCREYWDLSFRFRCAWGSFWKKIVADLSVNRIPLCYISHNWGREAQSLLLTHNWMLQLSSIRHSCSLECWIFLRYGLAQGHTLFRWIYVSIPSQIRRGLLNPIESHLLSCIAEPGFHLSFRTFAATILFFIGTSLDFIGNAFDFMIGLY